MKKIIFSLLAIALAACTAQQGSEFTRNRDKWQAAGIQNYRFNLMMVCFCAFSDQMPLTVEVRDGAVVSMTASQGSEVVPTDPYFDLFSQYSTIDKLFADLEINLNGGADEVIVTYDPTHGYPTQISYDFIKEAVDDELSLTISGFEVLE